MAGSPDLQKSRDGEYRETPGPGEGLRIVEAPLEDGTALIEIHGELDLAGVDELRAALERAGRDHSMVVLALAECDFIDCAAVEAILRARARLAAEECRLLLSAPRAQVRRVLALTGLMENGLVVERPEEAFS
jgi:anti-anti-sigma factor